MIKKKNTNGIITTITIINYSGYTNYVITTDEIVQLDQLTIATHDASSGSCLELRLRSSCSSNQRVTVNSW